MAVRDGSIYPPGAQKIDHQVFHADEERERDARQAELSGSDTQVPEWAATSRFVFLGGEQMTIVFGAYGSI